MQQQEMRQQLDTERQAHTKTKDDDKASPALLLKRNHMAFHQCRIWISELERKVALVPIGR